MADETNAIDRLQNVVNTLVEMASRVRGSRYRVMEGPVNWAEWNFESHPFAMAVMVDDCTIAKATNQEANLAIEVLARFPISSDGNPASTGTIEAEFRIDLGTMLAQLVSAVDSNMAPVIYNLDRGARIEAVHDADQGKVIGAVLRFRVEY